MLASKGLGMRTAVVFGFGLLGLVACHSAALYDLDTPIAIDTDNDVARKALGEGVAELGGRVLPYATQRVRVVSDCLCPGARAPNSAVAACTLGGVIYLCSAGPACPRCLKHELGHVFGALHSADSADLMYSIPKLGVESFSAADKQAICAMGFVAGGVCSG